MFALFTKIMWLVFSPSALISLTLVVGLRLLWRGDIRSAKQILLGGVAALLIVGASSLSDILIAPLENRFPRPGLVGASIDGLIVIGGAEEARIASSRRVIAVNDAAERYIETVGLARRFPKARVVFSGGGEVLKNATETEAMTAGRIFGQLGVEPSRIMLEDRSRTTWENAAFTAQMVHMQPGEHWLLVTSAWQMPRAMGAFRKAGLPVEAYPVDYRTTNPPNPWRIHTSLADGLRQFDYVLREYPALLVYWLTGRSTALFPGP